MKFTALPASPGIS